MVKQLSSSDQKYKYNELTVHIDLESTEDAKYYKFYNF